MSTKRAKWFLLVGSILGILCCVFGSVSVARNYNKRNPSERAPIRTLSIRIDEDERDELFSQLRKFSEKHHLEFSLSFYKGKEIFFVDMEGMGLIISALSTPVNTTELDIDFYEEDPTNPPPQDTIDELFSDLKTFISEIPNVTIIEEK
jgi:hypothetical protein